VALLVSMASIVVSLEGLFFIYSSGAIVCFLHACMWRDLDLERGLIRP